MFIQMCLPLGSLKSRYLDIPDDITANRTSFMVCRSKTKINNHRKISFQKLFYQYVHTSMWPVINVHKF